MPAADTRHILFVLGMHRSGTSALCAALKACGASFGSALLQPMDGVNEEGFWEDAEVVAVNESLLAAVGARWHSAQSTLLEQDWQSTRFEPQRSAARQIIQRGFGDGPVEAIKDPRLCLTLPFWLALCEEQGLARSVCVINRIPMEVARSLEQRDGFPPGYGLRLYQLYRQGIAEHVPPGTVYLSYDQLLADPATAIGELSATLGLEVSEAALAPVLRRELRHQLEAGASGLLYESDPGAFDAGALAAAIDREFPLERTLADLAGSLVDRGGELTRIGGAHATALATLDERDADLDQVSGQHRQALATINERDAQIGELDQRLAATGEHLAAALATIEERDQQIAEFDRRLAKLGQEHSYALELMQTRDAQLEGLNQELQRIFAKPGIGRLFRAMWKYDQG